MDEILEAYGAYFSIGKKPRHRQGALNGLDGFDVMVRFSEEIPPPAAAADQESPTGRIGRSGCLFE